jgi:hypothetical protein
MERLNKIKLLKTLGLTLAFVILLFSGTFTSANTDVMKDVEGEGPAATGSKAYRIAGADGTGITIAVIDNRFAFLDSAQLSGDAPPWEQIIDTFDFGGGGLTTGDYVHGTKCLEQVYDHAPGADYCLYRAKSGTNAATLTEAINRAIDQDVDIISMSITYFNQGWEDGTGGACAAVEAAADLGIIVFAAAGNFARQHWRGPFTDPGEDGMHNWDGPDEFNNVTLNPGQSMPVYLQWDISGGVTNYDLYIYDSTGTVKKDSSKNAGNTFEDLNYANSDTLNSEFVSIMVKKISGGNADLQLFARRSGGSVAQTLEDYKSGGSISSPANSLEPNVISVGAVHVDSFFYASGKDSIIRYYSSLGPSNSGQIKPELCAPTNCTTSLGTAGGTSAATPNAAGTAAAFWSSAPYLNGDAVRYLLLEKAEIFKDWGVAGNDTIYGRGGLRLHTYHDNTIWVDRRYENTDGWPWLPFYYVADAQSNAISGGRVVFLGQSYPEPVVLNKELLYESIGGPAVIGD